MSETSTAPLVISGQYIKDLSFEVPNAPEIFSKLKGAPDISISVDVNARRLQENTNIFEVILSFHVDSKVEQDQVFILELTYGAIVQITPAEPEHLQPLLLIETPRMLFPFARNLIADITRDGGFPPLMLQPIDFVTMYRQRMEALAEQSQQGNTVN